MKKIKRKKIELVSLFSGAGGLDIGFENAGFKVVWANEFDKDIWDTYEHNFHDTVLDKRSIRDIPNKDIPDTIGIIGGPPCQSWSLAGMMRGINDRRGQLFGEYTRLLDEKNPLFFLAENVPGIVSSAHIGEFERILEEFGKVGDFGGYNVRYRKLSAVDYGVPQSRERVFVVGYRKDLGTAFRFPKPISTKGGKDNLTQRSAFGKLPAPLPAVEKNKTNGDLLDVPNHEYFVGGFSNRFMSRNRIRTWDEPAFTIEASGRHAKLHPSSPGMIQIEVDKWGFTSDPEDYRRLSVRESAAVQTFPDDFLFLYKNVDDGYKMVGNAVPVNLAEAVAEAIYDDLFENGANILRIEETEPLLQTSVIAEISQ